MIRERERWPPALTRRRFIAASGAAIAALAGPHTVQATTLATTRPIPASGERIPAIGMGSWLTFDVRRNQHQRDQRVRVLQTFFDLGGGLVDSSPMYGSSEAVIGHCLSRIGNKQSLFSASKVWTHGQWLGIQQMQASQRLWGGEPFDLLQIHNLVDWRDHLETLREWQAADRVRYLGITTSHGRRHVEFADAMEAHAFDFVQFTYNLVDREAEQRLLPLARERGQAVIVNRPFRRGRLFDLVRGRPLPGWARQECECQNWAQFFLKWIISHPAVTCAIPATTRADHMRENMGAMYGRVPDASLRARMGDYFRSL